MNLIQLSTLLLVPMFSAQASAQVEMPVAATGNLETIPEETLQGTHNRDSDDALQVRVKGFLDTYRALRTAGSADWMTSRTWTRDEVKLEKGVTALFVSLSAIYNGMLEERTGIGPRGAYLSYTKGNLGLRVGRQIVIWGVAGALHLTDYVSPINYTESLTQDYGGIRMPVSGLHIKYTLEAVTAETMCNPVASFAVIPTDLRNPQAVQLPNTSLPYSIDLENGKPEERLKSMEYGRCISINLNGVDFSVSVLHTWNKLPALRMGETADGKSLYIDGRYCRTTMLGVDCSLPIGQFIIRAEVTKYINEAQDAATGCEMECRNALNTLIGIGWYPGNDWNAGLQYCHKYTLGSPEGPPTYRRAGIATARLAKELLQNTLKPSTFAYIDVTNGDIFNRFSVSYAPNDQVELTAGYNYFRTGKGIFKTYGKNSEAQVKMKYSS